MKKKENIRKDKLRMLFEHLEPEQPSQDFEAKLMQKIREEALQRELLKSKTDTLLFVICAILAVLASWGLYSYFGGASTQAFRFAMTAFQSLFSLFSAKITGVLITCFVLLLIHIILKTKKWKKSIHIE